MLFGLENINIFVVYSYSTGQVDAWKGTRGLEYSDFSRKRSFRE
jgi:hypothetical protein